MGFQVVSGADVYETAAAVSRHHWGGGTGTVVLAPLQLPQPQEQVTDVYVHKEFHWPLNLHIGQTDWDGPEFQNLDPRCIEAPQTTAIRQLQQRLREVGMGWDPIKFNWNKYYQGDAGVWDRIMPDAVFTNPWMNRAIGRWSGEWYICLRYAPESAYGYRIHQTIGGGRYDYRSQWEIDLQKRLDKYPGGLFGLWMGSPDGSIQYDGKYGSGPLLGVKMFNEMCGEGDDMKGRWVGDITKRNLEAGLMVNGRFDIATKVAVWLYQAKQRRGSNPFNIQREDGVVDLPTMLSLEYDVLEKRRVRPEGEQGSPEMLCAVPLAATVNGPLFPVPYDGVPTPIKNEIRRLGATRAIVVGTRWSIGGNVEAELRAMGLQVDRINGNDRYELSGNVSTWFGTGEKKVLVVNGEEHLMTYGIASYAAQTRTPIILTRQGTLTDYTKAMAGRFKASIIVGIERYVGQNVEWNLPNPERLSAPDRNRSAVEFHKALQTNYSNGIYVSTDAHWSDCYCGSVVAGLRNQPMLNYHKQFEAAKLPWSLGDYIQERGIQEFTFIGGAPNTDVIQLMIEAGNKNLNDKHWRMCLQPYYNK